MKAKTSEEITDWDREYINVDQGTLFEIILAANYLDLKGLLDLGCKTVANMIKGILLLLFFLLYSFNRGAIFPAERVL